MALRYWVGGTAAWDGTAGTKWALTSGGAGGEAVPTSADDVFLNGASGANTVTISTGNAGAKSITCTGFTGTLAGSANISVAGTVILVTGMTCTYSGTLTITATATLTSGGKTIGNVIINAPGGTVTLGSALIATAQSASSLTITAGTFTTSASNYSVTVDKLSSSNANTRTISLNGSTLTLNDSTTAVDFANSTNLTFNAGTSTISINGGLTSISLNGGGKTFYNVNFSNSPNTLSISGANTFNNVSFSSNTSNVISINSANTFNQLSFTAPDSTQKLTSIEFGDNQTITTLVASGNSRTQRIRFTSKTVRTQRTLTVTTWTTRAHMDFADIAFDTTRAATTANTFGDMGNNTNITFDTAKTVYWNLTGSVNWSSNGWALTSGGTPGTNNFPLAHDTVVFNFTGAAGTVIIDKDWAVGTVNMSARTSAMTLDLAAAKVFYITGSFTFGTGVTSEGTLGSGSAYIFCGTTTQTLDTAGVTLKPTINILASTLSLASNLTIGAVNNDNIVIVGGTITANTFNITADGVTDQDGAGTLNMGSGTWTLTGTGAVWNMSTIGAGTTINAGTANIVLDNTTTSSRTFDGANKSYNKLTIGGTTGISTLTIKGSNSFSELASTKSVAHTILFTAATTQQIDKWSIGGTTGNIVTIGSTTTSVAYLTYTGVDKVSTDYLSVSKISAAPTLTWYVGANSTDGGTNTNVYFTDLPRGNGLFFGSNF
mgnify:CR=1 FL=1